MPLIAVFSAACMLNAAPADVEKRVNELLSRMSLEEKIGQMSQLGSVKAPISAQVKEEIRKGRWGSILNAGLTPDRAEAQRIARTESRLKIPLLLGRDVVHGYRTIFPIPLGQSASWNPELIRQAARVAAREAYTDGIKWTFAPMIDISRDPRWGRIAETLGEDPYLTGVLGAAMVKGFQGDSLDAPFSVAACAKHYVGYGASESGKDYNTTWIPEAQLRDVFLPPFRAVIDAGVASVMSAFNDLNGVPTSGNIFTLRDVLRGEWKFPGLVVSDWESVTEMVKHGYAADNKDAARLGVLAGVDMEMTSSSYWEHLKSLVDGRQVSEKLLDESVRNILRLKFQLGLFDAPVPDPSKVATLTNPEPDGLKVAKQLALESAVLLKNDRSTLPIARSVNKVAIIGPLADSPVDQMGTWVMDGRPEDVITPLASFRQILGGSKVAWAQGLKNSRDSSHDGFAAAIAAAQSADVVLLFLGEEQILSGEAHSRAFIGLPGAQEALVAEVAKAGKPMVAVIMAGRPITFDAVAQKVSSVLYAWHPGTMGGPAIVELLLGDASPSGKLAVTLPRTVGQVPIYYSHKPTGRPPSDSDLGIPTGNPVDPKGYVSKYLDVDFTPQYPFGFGLSYTTFEYSNLRVSSPRIRPDGALKVSADLANTGSRTADEVVQLYVRDLVGSLTRPVRELKGFQRIRLQAGEKRTVEFSIAARDLAFHNRQMKLVTEPGDFHVWIAPDSSRGLKGEFAVVE